MLEHDDDVLNLQCISNLLSYNSYTHALLLVFQVEFGVDYSNPVTGKDGTAAGVFPIYRRLIGEQPIPSRVSAHMACVTILLVAQ